MCILTPADYDFPDRTFSKPSKNMLAWLASKMRAGLSRKESSPHPPMLKPTVTQGAAISLERKFTTNLVYLKTIISTDHN